MPRSAPTSSLERVIIDLRIPDWQIISSNTYEARVRPCNYICHCSTCSNKRSPPSPPETSSQLPPNPSSNLPNTRTLNKLLSAVFPLTTENIANSNSADYQPWPTAHQPPPAAAPAPVPIPTNFLPYYHPATPNIHLHWMVQHNTHPTNPATNNNSNQTAAGQAYIGAETEILARRDQLESFLHPLLRSTADQHGVLRKAREVKILVNANPGAACDNRCRGGVSVDCLRERVVDLCGGDGVDGEAKAKAQREEAIEVDCEGTALRAFMAGSRRC